MRRTPVAVTLLVVLARSLAGQDSTFLLSTTDPGYRTPTFLGNGAFSLVTTPLGTAPSLSFAAGVYDAAPGDVPRIAALPAWNAIDVFDGQAWLNATPPDTTRLHGYRQTVNLFDGTLTTVYDWVDGDRRASVSRQRRALCAQSGFESSVPRALALTDRRPEMVRVGLGNQARDHRVGVVDPDRARHQVGRVLPQHLC